MQYRTPDDYAAIAFDEWLLIKGVLDSSVLTEIDLNVWRNAFLEDMKAIADRRAESAAALAEGA